MTDCVRRVLSVRRRRSSDEQEAARVRCAFTGTGDFLCPLRHRPPHPSSPIRRGAHLLLQEAQESGDFAAQGQALEDLQAAVEAYRELQEGGG